MPNKELLAAASRQAADARARPVRHASEASAHHNNARLRAFLDTFGFDYEFASRPTTTSPAASTTALLTHAGALRRSDGDHAAVAARGARARPIRRSCRSIRRPASSCRCRSSEAHAEARHRSSWSDPDTAERFETPVTGGALQAAMEARLGDALGRARRRLRDGRQGPDRLRQALAARSAARSAARRRKASTTNSSSTRQGQKISKSKGNGLTIDEWLRYASPESLSLFMYREPKAAKRLLLRRHPAARRRVPAVPRRLSAAGRTSSGSPIRSGTSIPAQPPKRRHADHRSRCC